jgi:hypothetical protein
MMFALGHGDVPVDDGGARGAEDASADGDADERICPQCREPAGFGTWCDSCGFELSSVERLPTRAELEGEALGGPVPVQAGQRRLIALVSAIGVLAAGIALLIAALGGGS